MHASAFLPLMAGLLAAVPHVAAEKPVGPVTTYFSPENSTTYWIIKDYDTALNGPYFLIELNGVYANGNVTCKSDVELNYWTKCIDEPATEYTTTVFKYDAGQLYIEQNVTQNNVEGLWFTIDSGNVEAPTDLSTTWFHVPVLKTEDFYHEKSNAATGM